MISLIIELLMKRTRNIASEGVVVPQETASSSLLLNCVALKSVTRAEVFII